MSTDLRVQVASAPDREELVAEVWSGDDLVAEVRKEASGARLQIYPPKERRWWDFDHSELLEALQRAHAELYG